MNWNRASVFAFAMAAICLVVLTFRRAILANGPVSMAIQVAAVLLMIWARMAFGRRSFHAAATPAGGGLVTRGPYRWLRHPIYASVIWFIWAGVAAHPTRRNGVLAALVTVFLAVRMIAEEKLLAKCYPEYPEYARRTARIVPFLF